MKSTYFYKFTLEVQKLPEEKQKTVLEQLVRTKENSEVIEEELQQILNIIMPGMTIHDYRLLCFALNLYLLVGSKDKALQKTT